jgi:hypothetical protein
MGATNFSSVVDDIMTNTTVKANTSTASMNDYDFAKNNTNTGAAGEIILTLPSAAKCKEQNMKVYLTVAQNVKLTPQTGEKIFLAGSGTATKYLLIAGVIGNYCVVYCDGQSFYVTDYSGVLTKEA